MIARARDAYWEAVGAVLDPEVPVLSVIDLGIVRDIREEDGVVVVDVTPTYSGCPAMRVIEHDIVEALERAGATDVRVNTVFQPAWTTDWISEDARERLRAYGIAPPTGQAAVGTELIPLQRRPDVVRCPRCDSTRTVRRSEFGSTACKAIYFCDACSEPFEYLKPL
ncbi:MAG TPA: 1,2-phenylacetyl-CoA epoxidase subunit PaaD [Gemmatimonadaceae bacterium]